MFFVTRMALCHQNNPFYGRTLGRLPFTGLTVSHLPCMYWWKANRKKNTTTYLHNLIQFEQQTNPPIYFLFKLDLLKLKIKKWLESPEYRQDKSLDKFILQLQQQIY